MAITSLKTGSSFTNLTKYDSFLGPNSAYVPPSYESIASATGNGSSGTITFSSIPSTYVALQVRWIARNTDTGSDASIATMSVNGDTTAANYAWHELWGSGASVSVSGAASGLPYYGMVARNGATSGIVGAGVIDIHNYASSTQNKTIRTFSGNDRNGSGIVGMWSGLWENTNPITSITLYAETNGSGTNFTTATQFALYGIRGA